VLETQIWVDPAACERGSTIGWRLRRNHLSAAMRALEHDPEKWIPLFGKKSCSTNKTERDDDSKKNRHALGLVKQVRAMRGVTPALLACRRPLHRRLVESEKPTASPRRSPETRKTAFGHLISAANPTGKQRCAASHHGPAQSNGMCLLEFVVH
jgi:hypothetical protein